MSRKNLSAVLIVKNEEANLPQCIESLSWVDEIVVVDSGSTDRTMEIAREYGARVLETPWFGFGKTKQLAVDAATHDWVFSIDADEEVTEHLRCKIQSTLEAPENKGTGLQGVLITWGAPSVFPDGAVMPLYDYSIGSMAGLTKRSFMSRLKWHPSLVSLTPT